MVGEIAKPMLKYKTEHKQISLSALRSRTFPVGILWVTVAV